MKQLSHLWTNLDDLKMVSTFKNSIMMVKSEITIAKWIYLTIFHISFKAQPVESEQITEDEDYISTLPAYDLPQKREKTELEIYEGDIDKPPKKHTSLTEEQTINTEDLSYPSALGTVKRAGQLFCL